MLSLSKGKYLGSIRSSANADGILISTTEYFNDQRNSPMHFHESPHLSFVLYGDMLVKRKNTEYSLEELSYVQAGEAHQNRIHSDRCKNINLELLPDFFSRYNINESSISVSAVSSLLMVQLYRELLIQDESFENSVHSLVLSTVKTSEDNKFVPSWVKQVREILNDQWNESVSLEQISETIKVHPVTISKYFRKYFGAGFGQYRRRLKIVRAIMMMNSGKSLTEISYECGFFDQSHFIKAFRESTGFLPVQYRNHSVR